MRTLLVTAYATAGVIFGFIGLANADPFLLTLAAALYLLAVLFAFLYFRH